MKKESYARAMRSFEIEADALKATLGAQRRDVFEKAVDALCRAERIAASGCGHSGIACMHFAHSMCCVERPARFLSPAEAVHGAMGYVQKNDVVVLASRGGKTDELIPLIGIGKQKGATVISITENLESPMGREADIALAMAAPKESDRYNTQGTASFVALAGLFDALQVAVMEEMGYQREQFALVHPGGAVGKWLNSEK